MARPFFSRADEAAARCSGKEGLFPSPFSSLIGFFFLFFSDLSDLGLGMGLGSRLGLGFPLLFIFPEWFLHGLGLGSSSLETETPFLLISFID